MEILQINPRKLVSRTHFMFSISTKLRPKLHYTSFQLKSLCCSTQSLLLTLNSSTSTITELITEPTDTKNTVLNNSVRARVKVKGSDTQFKENWLASLSCPVLEKIEDGIDGGDTAVRNNVGPQWVIGIDPDLSGALAVLKSDAEGCTTAQVFDSPHLQVMVGKRIRRRLDTNSIVKLLQSFDAPVGTIAYLEQSTPFPQDGKQGWWSGGFGYGLWIGVLVASGFSVVPVPSCTWKNEFELSGKQTNKDDSRRVASTLFPSMSSLLKRKKDHGRAEALLIAAYGKGIKIKSKPLSIAHELVP